MWIFYFLLNPKAAVLSYILILYKMGHLSSFCSKIPSVPFKSTIIFLRSLQFSPDSWLQRMTTWFKFYDGSNQLLVLTFVTVIYYCKKQTNKKPKLSGLKQQFIVISHGFIGWLVSTGWVSLWIPEVKIRWKLRLEWSEVATGLGF